jgi:SAM-dependent methyltransferase
MKSIFLKVGYALASWFNPVFAYYRLIALVDRLRGLDFLGIIQPGEVGLDPNLYFKSSSSGNRYLIRMLKDFQITEQDAIIDVGCGKGGAMKILARFPFARADGIELSPHIAAIAERNLAILKARRSRVYCGDAAIFPEYARYNMIYLYNPFAVSVMVMVMAAIDASLAAHDREVIILYNNPTCHDAVVASGSFVWYGEYADQWRHGIRIYSNRPLKSSRLAGVRRMRRIDGSGPTR